ncbi:hypothetical protein OAW23_04275 [Flavobacteriales bacterium]|nr:hypothetical protein [Flavobacteriales bacterium]MDC3337064.1 hypothetical protein [Flavobacteriales bacterium]
MKKHFFLFFSLALLSCEDNENAEGVDQINGEQNVTIGTEDLLKQKVASIENIFYSIPSPTVTIEIIEEAGAVFDVQLTNNPQKLDDYTSKAERALNMGVYGADVNYCSAFNKTADVMMLLACTRSLGEELGLESIFNQTVIDRLNDNRDNADSVQAIITSTFWEIESKLEEDDRPELAALIVIGGWVEGLNIACGQAKLNANNEKMIGSIVDQSIALDNVIRLAKLYSSSSTTIKELLESLEDLQSSFAKIEITESPGASESTDGVPTIGVKIDRKISTEVLEEIMSKVHTIRTEIVE